MQINENTYDELVKDCTFYSRFRFAFTEKLWCAKCRDRAFASPDNGPNIIYLSSMHIGIIIVTTDENGHPIINDTNLQEIWRYLYGPSKISKYSLYVNCCCREAQKCKRRLDKLVF